MVYEPDTAIDAVYECQRSFLYIQQCDDGYDYTFYNKDNMRLVDGGVFEEGESYDQIAKMIAESDDEVIIARLYGFDTDKFIN